MADRTANVYRVFVCSGRLQSQVAAGFSSLQVLGCTATCLATNPLAWQVTYDLPSPVPSASDFSELEISLSGDFGDGSAAALSSFARPSNITSTGFIINFYDKNGAAVATNIASCWFQVWRRPKQF